MSPVTPVLQGKSGSRDLGGVRVGAGVAADAPTLPRVIPGLAKAQSDKEGWLKDPPPHISGLSDSPKDTVGVF